MQKKQQGLFSRFATSAKAASLAWGGAQVSQTALQSEISATLVGGVPVGKIRLSTDSFFTLWRNHGDISSCIDKIGDSVGVAGWVWKNKKNPEAEANPASVAYAESVLSFYCSIRSWYRDLIQDNKICGNAYYHVERSMGNGKPLAITRIDPRTLTAVTDKYGTLVRWIQRTGMDVQDFKPEEVLHYKTTKDPNSPVYGISPMESILWEVRTDIAAMINNYGILENDGVPAALYVFEDNMNEEEMNRAVDFLKEQIKGSQNRHKAVAMKGLKEIKPISITNTEMEFSVLRKLTTDKVCARYRVPKSLLGYTENVNLANGKEQTAAFWEGTIESEEGDISEFINRIFLPAIGIDDITHEFNVRSFDSREWDEASSRADVQLGISTINEARVARGKEPYDAAKYGELVDTPLIFAGLSVRPLEDIGVDVMDPIAEAVVDEASAEKALHRLDHLGRAYENNKKRAANAR